jgi:hypothetical protein
MCNLYNNGTTQELMRRLFDGVNDRLGNHEPGRVYPDQHAAIVRHDGDGLELVRARWSFLSAIGLLTSVFFFLCRDVYATILFHNFLGMFGVVQALRVQDNLGAFQTVQASLVGTALVALLVLIAADLSIVRRSHA